MPHPVMPLPFKPPRLEGLSERLLAGHYENDYGAALRRLNAPRSRPAATGPGREALAAAPDLEREARIAARSVARHEIYFDGLGGQGGPDGRLAAAFERDFGSVERCLAALSSHAKSLDAGCGWALLGWSPREGRLTVESVADDAHAGGENTPVLAIDMYEHAYRADFGEDAGSYVDAVLRNLHWGRVATRLEHAVAGLPHAAPAADPAPVSAEALRALLDARADVTVLDVCLAEDLAKRSDKVPGALVRAPERLDEWAGELPRDRRIVAYCVYGFQVSGNAVAALRERGLDARILAGGIAAWHALGAPTEPLRPRDR